MKFLSMKRMLLAVVAILMAIPSFAGDKDKINWMTWDEVQVAMKKKPKKVWVDVYTDWCGWCKVMDKKVFNHPDVIKYMNENFYAVKFDAETKEDIRFMGKIYKFQPSANRSGGTNALAIALLRGQLSYPTNVFMEENFQNPSPIPGYNPVPRMEMILKFLGEGTYKTQQFPEFEKSFKGTWKEKG